MTAKIPVLPTAVAALLRAAVKFTPLAGHALNGLGRALRHCGEARKLAGLGGHMLADIGITRADLRDSFSAPFWKDPTDLLAERVSERRRRRTRGAACVYLVAPAETGFLQPPTNRPARQSI